MTRDAMRDRADLERIDGEIQVHKERISELRAERGPVAKKVAAADASERRDRRAVVGGIVLTALGADPPPEWAPAVVGEIVARFRVGDRDALAAEAPEILAAALRASASASSASASTASASASSAAASPGARSAAAVARPAVAHTARSSGVRRSAGGAS